MLYGLEEKSDRKHPILQEYYKMMSFWRMVHTRHHHANMYIYYPCLSYQNRGVMWVASRGWWLVVADVGGDITICNTDDVYVWTITMRRTLDITIHPSCAPLTNVMHARRAPPTLHSSSDNLHNRVHNIFRSMNSTILSDHEIIPRSQRIRQREWWTSRRRRTPAVIHGIRPLTMPTLTRPPSDG